jgi:putative cell wall-binding protein
LPDRVRASFVTIITVAAMLLATAPSPVAAAGQKVVIIVGPTGAQTDQYRSFADEEASAATALGANVVKVYSPKATWANVKAAVDGANVIIYHGHGSGFPNPYGSTELTDRANGWGLNKTETGGDSESGMVYCGERALLGALTSKDGVDQRTYCAGGPITPAANFVMIYANACYTAGSSEPGKPVGDLATARARVANFSYPVLKLGANGYFATDLGATQLLRDLLSKATTSFGDIYRSQSGYDAGAQRLSNHPDLDGRQVWVQKTYSRWLGTDYWYAFAGNPNATPSNGTIAPPPPVVSVDIQRLAGSNRYATAAAVSAASFDPGVPTVFVATGTNFPDALAAGAAAAERNSPLLLTAPTSLPAETAAELARLQPKSITVLGSSGAVSDGVAAQLGNYTAGSVTRLAGADRYATAAATSAATFSSGVPVVYVATGANFPDALAGVPASGVKGGPVLLVTASAIPATTQVELSRLRPGRIVILGASGVISDGVAATLAGFTSGDVSRLAGTDRYATAAAISKATFATADTVFIATGLNFADALGGGPVAGIGSAPLLLVSATGVPTSIASELLRLNPSHVTVLGGTGVVSESVQSQIESLLGGG